MRNIHKLPGAVAGKKTGKAKVDKLHFVLPVPSGAPNGMQRRLNYSVGNGLLSARTTTTQQIVGSPNVNSGYKLIGNSKYPRIATDYEKTFRVLASLPCDVFLGAHGVYYDMDDKLKRLRAGGRNPFIDPEGYRAYIKEREQSFRAELSAQQQTR